MGLEKGEYQIQGAAFAFGISSWLTHHPYVSLFCWAVVVFIWVEEARS
jgi:hypothetical protein